jgi:hypothetical protein
MSKTLLKANRLPREPQRANGDHYSGPLQASVGQEDRLLISQFEVTIQWQKISGQMQDEIHQRLRKRNLQKFGFTHANAKRMRVNHQIVTKELPTSPG